MKKILLVIAAAAAVAGATAPAASACDPGMPTCYGPEAWLKERLYTIDRYVIQPTEQKVEELRESFDLGCPGPYC